ncbi:MAG: hypothetical protein IJQ58_06960 [Synergistaceae bacterium]|nr:hypothetical protein [Synergistaceae bacterium]
MTDEQNSQCHKIIHTAAASASAIAAGLAQIPGSDAIPITGIQIGMIIGLGAVFGRDVSESTAKSILGGAIAVVGGRTVSQFLVGWLPGIGNAINATTAFTITETLGWYVANDFSEETEKLAEQTEQTTLQKQASMPAQAKQNSYTSQISLCVVFSCVIAVACMLVDAGLERFILHFKIWGAVSGIILAAIFNVVIYAICKNKGWSDKIRPTISYSNVLAMVINLVFALVISSENDVLRWDNVHGWDEAVAEFFRTPFLNWGLLIIAVFWWFEVDRKIINDLEFIETVQKPGRSFSRSHPVIFSPYAFSKSSAKTFVSAGSNVNETFSPSS